MEAIPFHIHRDATKADFEGKTIARFEPSAANIWRFWFTDGTSFAIQTELHYGIPIMELCDECVGDDELDDRELENEP